MRLRLVLLAAALLAAPALAQPSETPAPAPSKKDKEQPRKPELPKPPAPKPASEITLKVGDKAPTFRPDLWIRPIPPVSPATTPATPSAPVPGAESATLTFEPGKVYVIEFWATWCQSCREAMPGLAKLARANKDLVIIGVASSERKPAKDATDERSAVVRRFVDEHAGSFPYGVVFDGSRSIANSWIAAAGRVYIPTSFVVDSTGTIIWIGDPRESGFETAVTRALKQLPQPVKPVEPIKPEPPKKSPKPRSKP